MKLPNIFNNKKEVIGIKKDDVLFEDTTSFIGFFKLYFRKFWNLSSANMIYVVLNFPVFFFLVAVSGFFDVFSQAPNSPLYAPLYGISLYGANPLVSTLLSVLSGEMTISMNTTTSFVFYALSGLLIFTFGPANAGLAAVLRNYCRGDSIYMASEFFEAIKKNFFQALILGIIDIAAVVLFVYNLMFYYLNGASLMMYVTIALLIVFFCMRMYMYVVLVTFKLSIFKILKNSFIFALIGYKRNIAAVFGIILTFALNWYIVMLFFPLGFILPFLITVATFAFVATYCAYPNIKKYMIDPYYSSGSSSVSIEEPIFKDRG